MHHMLLTAAIPIAEAARELGVSREHLSQMLHGHLPMRMVYGLALRQMVTDKATEH
jgi:hypothetical protein